MSTVTLYTGLFLLSAGTLVFELTLTRIFSVTQFYHFAFMVVSLALLGYGASGSLLTIIRPRTRDDLRSKTGWLALGCAISIVGSYLVINRLPFDSYAIAWDKRQMVYLVLYFLSLAVPFGFSGFAVGLLLAARPADANRIYAVNLIGSAVGCLLVLPALPLSGGTGTTILAAWMAAAAAVLLHIRALRTFDPRGVLSIAVLVVLSIWLPRPPPFMQLQLSPYKGLYQALLNPEATHVSTRWNAFSRVDVVESPSIRSLPGLSFSYTGTFPQQVGVSVDGDNLMPITVPPVEKTTISDELPNWAEAMPEALAYQLRPGTRALILDPGGGLGVTTALANGAADIVVVESNPLLIETVRDDYRYFNQGLYSNPRVQLHNTGPRAYVRKTSEYFSVIHPALIDPLRPVRSGVFSLGENYLYTVDAFTDYMNRLEEDGILVVSRWIQATPSEMARLFATALEALERIKATDPASHLVAYRSFQTGTLLVKGTPWTQDELTTIQLFCKRLRYDLAFYPEMPREEANQYTVLSEPIFYHAFTTLANATVRQQVYRQSEFDIAPSTDNRPFFSNFFKWRQTPQVFRELGKSWQPFGGAGYFVLLVMLALALGSAAVFILLPLVLLPKSGTKTHLSLGSAPISIPIYFGSLGLGFLMVEIPLIQKFTLFVDQPTLSVTAVLFVVLLCSGAGSLTAKRWRLERALALLVAAALLYPPGLQLLYKLALGWSLGVRLALTLVALAPLCYLMGIPFARGLALLGKDPRSGSLIPWAWAINGSASVVAGILAAMLELTIGFNGVLWLGSGVYAVACFAFRRWAIRV